jgi:hypothetical protein
MKTLQARSAKVPKTKVPKTEVGSPSSLWTKSLATARSQQQSGDWVRLTELPSPYSFDEALLLCETEPGYWLAWVPDFGELLIQV